MSLDQNDPSGHATLYSYGYGKGKAHGNVLTLRNTGPVVRPVIAERMMRVAYQQEYGICDHEANGYHPLDVVTMHPKEDYVEGGAVRTLQRKYLNLDIWDTWHVSLNEFMEMPYPDAMFVIEVAEHLKQKKIAEAKRLSDEMRDAANNKQK